MPADCSLPANCLSANTCKKTLSELRMGAPEEVKHADIIMAKKKTNKSVEKQMNPENGLSETLYFPDRALKNIMRDAVFFFYYYARPT